MTDALSINGLVKFYGDKRAVDGVSFSAPQGQITGVLGPHSNAHGPNEFLHIPTGKRVTEAVAHVVAAHFEAGLQGLTHGVAAVGGHAAFGDHGCC